MKVRLVVGLTGLRDGVEWPARGEVMDLPDAEAVDMLNGGLAEAVEGDAPESAMAKPAKGRAAKAPAEAPESA